MPVVNWDTGEVSSPPATLHHLPPTPLAENSIVLAWFINSMKPHTRRRNLWFETTKDVWDATGRMYSDFGNMSQVFELRSKLEEMKQSTKSVIQYFSDLEDIWQELDSIFEDANPCVDCCVTMRRHNELSASV